MQTAEQLIRDLYDAFGAKDEARLREILSPTVEWNQCAGFPGGKNRRGADDVLAGILGTNHSIWEGFRAETSEFVAAGDTVIVLGAYSGAHAETKKAMRADFAHVYRVAEGRVVRFDQITDTAPMVAAMT